MKGSGHSEPFRPINTLAERTIDQSVDSGWSGGSLTEECDKAAR